MREYPYYKRVRRTRIALVVALALSSAAWPAASADVPVVAAWPVDTHWSRDFPFGVEFTLVMGDSRLFVVEPSRISAHATADGTVLWTHAVTATARPAVDEGRLFVAADESIRALSEVSGHEQWRLRVGRVSIPPTTRAGWVIAASEDGGLHGISATEGRPIWRIDLPAPLTTPVSIDGDLVVGASTDGRVRGWRITDGALRWTRELGARPTQILAAGGAVFVAAESGQLFSLRQRDGRVNWVYRFGMPIVGRLSADSQHVYLTTLDNSVHAHTFNGHRAWHQLLASRVVDGVFADAGTVFVPQSNGEVRMFVASGGMKAGRLSAPKESANVIGGLVSGGAGQQLRMALITSVASQLAVNTYRRPGLGAVPATSAPPGRALEWSRPGGRP